MIKNFEKLVVSTVSNTQNTWLDIYTMKPEERETIENENHKNMQATIAFIEKSFNSCLSGLDPVMQSDIDDEMM